MVNFSQFIIVLKKNGLCGSLLEPDKLNIIT
jgi:hypothetical protein